MGNISNKGIIDEIRYLDDKIEDLGSKIEKGEDLLQELRVRRYLNREETRKFNTKFHQDVVINQERELCEIDLQIHKTQTLVTTHRKKQEEYKRHLEELEQQWRKQSLQDTPFDESITNDTVFFDEENGYLWISDSNKESVEPEDVKILKAIKDILTSNKHSSCRIEEVILNAYGKEIHIYNKITQNPMYDKYRTAVGAINGKYRELLKTKDKNTKLIQSDGKRMVKFTKNVVFRNMLRKQP